jgi:hypothetical protein
MSPSLVFSELGRNVALQSFTNRKHSLTSSLWSPTPVLRLFHHKVDYRFPRFRILTTNFQPCAQSARQGPAEGRVYAKQKATSSLSIMVPMAPQSSTLLLPDPVFLDKPHPINIPSSPNCCMPPKRQCLRRDWIPERILSPKRPSQHGSQKSQTNRLPGRSDLYESVPALFTFHF